MQLSGDQPLHGKRVLITRAGKQSEFFANALRVLGAEPLVAPTVAIEVLDDLSALNDAIDLLADFEWLVFTSQNAVDVCMLRAAARGASVDAVKIAAIGPQTARRLGEYGARAALIAERHVSEALAADIVAVASPGARVLVVRALEGRDVLQHALEDAGLQVTAVPAYRTVTAHDPEFAEKVRLVDTVTFTSASTVQGFVTLMNGAAVESMLGKCVACIGPVTADAARDAGLRVDVIAEHYTIGGLLDALSAHYGAGA